MNGTDEPLGPAPMPDNQGADNIPKKEPAVPEGLPIAPQAKPAGEKREIPVPPPPPPPPPPSPPPPRVPPTPGGPSAPPPPPPPQVDIRTMGSDSKSIKETGGIGVEPKTFKPEDFAKGPVFQPPEVKAEAKKLPSSRGRAIAIVIGIVFILGAAAAAAYFFVIPLFTAEEPADLSLPSGEETLPPEDTGFPTQPTFEHKSFFATPADGSGTMDITELSVPLLSDAIENQISNVPNTEWIEEFSLSLSGVSVRTQDFLDVFLPEVDDGTVFEEDFTGFIYLDNSGVWPGYVFKLQDGASIASVKASVKSALEEGVNLNSFYITSPGVPDVGGFKDGSVSGITTRYLPFSGDGASMNYGWFGDYLVISTSFQSFKEAVSLLKAGG